MTSIPWLPLVIEHGHDALTVIYATALVLVGFALVLREREGGPVDRRHLGDDVEWPAEFLFSGKRRPAPPRCRAVARRHRCVLFDSEEAQP